MTIDEVSTLVTMSELLIILKIYTLCHDLNDSSFSTKGAPVNIEDNVFVFSNAMIMPGVTIGEGAIVLAGSVVTKDVEPWTIVGGNPAKK